LMMSFKPHIFHIVGFTEGSHASTALEVIESAKIVNGVFKNLANGFPSFLNQEKVVIRARSICDEALTLLSAIEMLGRWMGSSDPLADPVVLVQAIESGLLDAPLLRGQPVALGLTLTAPRRGGCVSTDTHGKVITEQDRLLNLLPKLPLSKGEILSIEPLFKIDHSTFRLD
jgi:hypothetical protein